MSRGACIVRLVVAPLLVALLGCRAEKAPDSPPPPSPSPAEPGAARPAPADDFAAARNEMVDQTIANRGVTDPRVIAALRKVKRHELVPAQLRTLAYEDIPLPIGFEHTIS